MSQQLEYTYKLYRDNNELVVTVDPLVKDIESSLEKMMEMNIDELSDENKQARSEEHTSELQSH